MATIITEAEIVKRLAKLPPGHEQALAYQAYLQLSSKNKPAVTPQAKILESRGCFAWYAEMFGQKFVDGLASHHRQAVEWHWFTRTSLIEIELTTNNLEKQLSVGAIDKEHHDAEIARLDAQRNDLFLAYFTIWARGNMKTTVARRVAIADACLTVSAKLKGFCLVVSGTKLKVHGTAGTIDSLLTTDLDTSVSTDGSRVWKYYPGLARVRRTTRGFSKSWTTDIIQTDAGYIFQFVGLDQSMAGANIEGERPSFILPDDIDNRKDSPVIAERNFNIFRLEVLPMRQHNTLVFFAQNLISRFSVMYRIWKQQVKVLTNRLLTNPIPAVLNLVTETRVVHGIVKDVLVPTEECKCKPRCTVEHNVPTWQGWSRQRIQEEIDTEGLPAFKRECQHEVEESKEGLVLQYYDDTVQVITRDEFADIYGTRDIPMHWYKYFFNDWARTKTKFHANVAGVVTVSSQNSQFPGAIFIFYPMSFPAASQPDDAAKRFLETISPTVVVDGVRMTWSQLIKSTLQNSDLDALTSNLAQEIEQRRAMLANVIPERIRPILAAQHYKNFRMSHERTDIQKIMRRVFGLPFVGTNPGSDGGLDYLNLYQKIDYEAPHPFREGHKGFTKFFIVVDHDKLPYPDAIDPKDLHDSDLLRYQLNNWRWRDPFLTVKGEKEGELLKMNDDFPNGLMMLFYDNCVKPAPLTADEHFDATLPVKIQNQTIANITNPEEKARAVTARAIAERRLEQTNSQKQLSKTSSRNRIAMLRKLQRKG